MQTEQLGGRGESCASCGAGLDTDQRYCLNCGTRRAGPRLDFEGYMGEASAMAGSVPVPPAPAAGGPALAAVPVAQPPRNDWTPFAAVSILAGLGVLLVIGVLIGRGNSTAAPSQPVVLSGAGTATADTAATPDTGGAQAETASTGPFSSDWPGGKTGFTVELGTLPKQGSSAADVATAKTDVEGKGAADVGALDSDDYPSLPSGSYIIYSGVFDTKAEAAIALGKLKDDFPDATVVKVSEIAATPVSGAPTSDSAQDLVNAGESDQPVTASDDSLDELASQSGEDYEDTIKKLPNQISTEGKPPPIDTTGTPPGGSAPGPTTVIK